MSMYVCMLDHFNTINTDENRQIYIHTLTCNNFLTHKFFMYVSKTMVNTMQKRFCVCQTYIHTWTCNNLLTPQFTMYVTQNDGKNHAKPVLTLTGTIKNHENLTTTTTYIQIDVYSTCIHTYIQSNKSLVSNIQTYLTPNFKKKMWSRKLVLLTKL